ncbi:MAG TPA: DNA replication/repair protein RecF [Stellaceae bacterium]|nr:DNA replication/repair protein RecF [Stellaceae bacterium]
MGVHEGRYGADIAVLPPRFGPVGVTRLTLTDFRNYRTARLELAAGGAVLPVIVLTGPNGAGKTNLLEAVSLLSPGRGLRNARLADLDRRRAADEADTGWAVAATIDTRRGDVRIGTGRDPTVGLQPPGLSRGGERRVVRIDGENARGQAALGEVIGVTWLTPQMDRLFIEGPSARRRFLDRLVLGLDPAHAARVSSYEHAMRERSRLLRDGQESTRLSDPVWLDALDETMAAQGVAVAAARREAVERLDEACVVAEGPFPRARLTLQGTVEAWLDELPALAAEDRFRATLRDNRAVDAASGGALVGPHRSDLAVTHAEGGVAAESMSTGEQKALLISIVLAHAKLQRQTRGEPPLLLLDEVAAHLDAARRDALFTTLLDLESQVWLTGTDAAIFAPLRDAARFLSVTDGALSETTF